MIKKLKKLYQHIADLDSGSDDANTLLWAINEIESSYEKGFKAGMAWEGEHKIMQNSFDSCLQAQKDKAKIIIQNTPKDSQPLYDGKIIALLNDKI